jgi:putative ubiquitin-RnfH superfamily antitoxin RatB of RatAB toxin-antitoxin module
MIEVEVAYAKPEQQFIVALELPENVTAEQAIVASGLLSRCPEIDLTINKVGIFATACGLDQPLRQGDRVEIYRPLAHDPKDARRQRASSYKKAKK